MLEYKLHVIREMLASQGYHARVAFEHFGYAECLLWHFVAIVRYEGIVDELVDILCGKWDIRHGFDKASHTETATSDAQLAIMGRYHRDRIP